MRRKRERRRKALGKRNEGVIMRGFNKFIGRGNLLKFNRGCFLVLFQKKFHKKLHLIQGKKINLDISQILMVKFLPEEEISIRKALLKVSYETQNINKFSQKKTL